MTDDTPVSFVPMDEQQQIVSRIEDLFARADAIETAAEAAKRYADKLDQSILARAFRGELVPQDPTDEPASALLERIHTEGSRDDTIKGHLASR